MLRYDKYHVPKYKADTSLLRVIGKLFDLPNITKYLQFSTIGSRKNGRIKENPEESSSYLKIRVMTKIRHYPPPMYPPTPMLVTP